MQEKRIYRRTPFIVVCILFAVLFILLIPTTLTQAKTDDCEFGELQTIFLDGMDIHVCLPFYPDLVIPAGEKEIIQSGSFISKEPYQQLLIYPVAYGLVPAASDLPLSEEGASYFYKEKTMLMMFSEGENILDISPNSIFQEEVKPFAAITPLTDADSNEGRLNVVWILEAGERIWMIQYNEIGNFSTDEQISEIYKKIAQINISSEDLANPSSARKLFEKGDMSGEKFEKSAEAASMTDLPFPSWWSGDCNVNNHPGSYALGASFRGVSTCGPRNTEVWVNFGAGVSQLEWQCPELSKRYLYLAFGIPPFSANGKDVVNNFPADDRFEKVANGTFNKIPIVGDVLSYNGPSIYGHTSVVSTSSVDANGNGSITIIEQNYSTTGTRTHNVVGWYVRSSDGVSGWLHQVGDLPQPAVQISPSGGVAWDSPTFTWNAVSNSISYQLWVESPEGMIFNQWYTAAQAGCSSGGKCSITPSLTVGEGVYRWLIQTWNTYGYGEWSAGLDFYKGEGNLLEPASQLSPSGTILDTTPTFNWNANGSPWYYLLVQGPGGNLFDQWYSAAEAGCNSGGGTCSITPANIQNSGDYRWWALGFNNHGEEGWGPEMNYSVDTETITFGFDTQFNRDAQGWTTHKGEWELGSNEYYSVRGERESRASISYDENYSDFDYQVRMKREGCNPCANTIFVRGNPEPLWDQNRWKDGYLFQYTRNGNFSVWEYNTGGLVTLQSWTPSPSIKKMDGWNTLRVVGNGNKLYFYINGDLVWVGTDTSFPSGRVGIGMYGAGVSGDRLLVDWATLTTATGGPDFTDQISDAQMELNQEAVNDGSDNVDNEASE